MTVWKRVRESRRTSTLVFACLLIAFTLAPVSRAEEPTGITVLGFGKSSSKPTSVEIPCIVSGDAELTADAIVKYRDARKRAVAAIEALKIPNLSIDSKGYSVKDYVDSAAQQQAMMRGQIAPSSKQKVSVTEQLLIRIKDIDKMDQAALMDTTLKVLDTVRDSGLTLGDGTVRNYNQYPPPPGPSLVNFKITDTTALREQAYKDAIEDAKSKAQKLADLSGLKLGRILSLRDGAQQTKPPSYAYESILQQASNAQSGNELVSTTFDEIPMNITLTVQFEIQK